MRDQSIRGHLNNLTQQGEMIRFTHEVDPDTNMSAISYKAFAEQGKSCLFENIAGCPEWRVASQIVADRGKWAIALGVDEADVVPTLNDRIAKLVDPVEVSADQAPVKEVIKLEDEVDLTQLPAMWTSEKDPGRYIAAGMCVIKDPETGIRNVSVHRAQVVGPNTTGYLICPRQALKIYQMYGELGRPMEVAMVIGAHPALIFASGFVAPYGIDEWSIAGGLLEDPIRMVKCETIDMEVPAEAELVLEGEIYPAEMTEEGPFGEVTGTYAQEGATPLFRVKAVTHRRDPIFYAMQCGLPPSDTHSIIHTTIEMKLWEHIRDVAGGLDLKDIRCFGGVTPMMVVVKLAPKSPGQAKAAALAAVSSPYLHPKFAIAVDADVDAADVDEIMASVLLRVTAAADVQLINNTRVFALDNASPVEPGMSAMYRVGSKMIIDATAADGTDGGTVPQLDGDRRELAALAEIVKQHIQHVEGGLDLLDVQCHGTSSHAIVVIKLRPRCQGQSKTALLAALSSPDIRPRLAVTVDEDIDAGDLREVAWSVASRVHAERDTGILSEFPQLADGGGETGLKWYIDSAMPALTQSEGRTVFERAVPKNLDLIHLAEFLP